METFVLKTHASFWGNLGAKLKFWAPAIYYFGNSHPLSP